ncbi:MAG: glycosyltransferase [Cyanophyceae cyanobacterium]
MVQRLGYLSAAPRVSTRPDADAAGPRSHVLGVIQGFEALGWQVHPFIVGDRVSRQFAKGGSPSTLSSSLLKRLAADVVRLSLGTINSRRAWQELQGVDWVYERFASLQALGGSFQRRGIPWILETNALYFYEAKVERKSVALGGLARQLELRAYQQCNVLVCISDTLKEIILSETGMAPEKIVVMPNGVDTDFFNPDLYSSQRVFDNFTVGFIGTLSPWQRLDLLLEAVRELQVEGLELSLVVVGDGMMYDEWRSLAEQLELARVQFVGRIPRQEIPQWIAGFDVGYSGHAKLQIGKVYQSPLKLYEYMAMSKPVVASALEDSQRVIQNGVTGFLFEGGNKEDLKQALTKAYQSQSMLPTMGRRAREEIVAKHSWKNRVSTLIAEVERRLK